MNAISNDDVKKINWIKSARVGATKIMLCATAYMAHHKKRNQLFYQPTNDDAKEFVNTEVNTMLRDVKCMYEIFPDIGKKSSKNTDSLKQFIGSSFYIKGANAAGNFRRLSVDIVYYDELEGFNKDVQGEGSPLTLGDKRLEGSLVKKSIRMTTPKYKDGSLIEPEVRTSDALFKYKVPCPHCGDHQVLKWGGNDVGYGFKWIDDDPSTTVYLCEHCACEIENNHLHDMNESGYWECERTNIRITQDDRFIDENGIEIKAPKNISFHIWTAYSPFVRWAELVSDFITAQRILKEDGDITKLKTFVNTTLGEVWEDVTEGEKLNPELLYNKREHYPEAGFSKRGLVVVGGFDMQDDRIEGEVRAYGLNGENWLIDYFVLRGDPAQPELWDRLHERVNKHYKREDGQLLPISRICFDSGGHYTTQVYEFSKRAGINFIIPIKGASDVGAPMINYPRTRTKDGVYLTMVGTDTCKDIIYSRLKLENDDYSKPMNGYYHFPIADFCDRTYFDQLVAERKILKKYRGKMMRVYDAGSRRNEALDCAVYSLAAFKISVEIYGLNLNSLAEKVENPQLRTSSENNFLKAIKALNGG